MKIVINQTADGPGLKARIGVAKGYRRCHRSKNWFCDEASTAAECVDVVTRPRPILSTDYETPIQ